MVYGRIGGVAIYELLAIAEPRTKPPGWVALYESGLATYRNRDFAGAVIFFQKLLDIRASDKPARIMLERCSHYPVSYTHLDRQSRWRSFLHARYRGGSTSPLLAKTNGYSLSLLKLDRQRTSATIGLRYEK